MTNLEQMSVEELREFAIKRNKLPYSKGVLAFAGAFDEIARRLKEAEEREKAQSEREKALPKEPPLGLLVSMAIRNDHGLGVPGYYDQFEPGSHRKRMDAALSEMRKLYEEVSGYGFYQPEKDEYYESLMRSS